MQGGSQASLIETGHGFFVVKWLQNAQHRRVLINEAVCSELLGRLGVALPEWAFIGVDRHFLEHNSEICISGPNGNTPVEPGWHFGSRFPVDPRIHTVYQDLPAHLIDKVHNRWDFLKVLVFDVWVDNRDGRQAVFFRSGPRGLRAEMIDHGHGLGFDGVEWRFCSSPVRQVPPEMRKRYACPEAAAIYEQAMTAIQHVTRDDLESVLSRIPGAWLATDGEVFRRHLDRLIDRAKRLGELMSDTLAWLRD